MHVYLETSLSITSIEELDYNLFSNSGTGPMSSSTSPTPCFSFDLFSFSCTSLFITISFFFGSLFFCYTFLSSNITPLPFCPLDMCMCFFIYSIALYYSSAFIIKYMFITFKNGCPYK